MSLIVAPSSIRERDYTGNFVLGHLHKFDSTQFVMKYEGSINKCIKYYRDNAQQSGSPTKKPIDWFIGRLPQQYQFEENLQMLFNHLDTIFPFDRRFPTGTVRTLEQLERIVTEASSDSTPSAAQTQ